MRSLFYKKFVLTCGLRAKFSVTGFGVTVRTIAVATSIGRWCRVAFSRARMVTTTTHNTADTPHWPRSPKGVNWQNTQQVFQLSYNYLYHQLLKNTRSYVNCLILQNMQCYSPVRNIYRCVDTLETFVGLKCLHNFCQILSYFSIVKVNCLV